MLANKVGWCWGKSWANHLVRLIGRMKLTYADDEHELNFKMFVFKFRNIRVFFSRTDKNYLHFNGFVHKKRQIFYLLKGRNACSHCFWGEIWLFRPIATLPFSSILEIASSCHILFFLFQENIFLPKKCNTANSMALGSRPCQSIIILVSFLTDSKEFPILNLLQPLSSSSPSPSSSSACIYVLLGFLLSLYSSLFFFPAHFHIHITLQIPV